MTENTYVHVRSGALQLWGFASVLFRLFAFWCLQRHDANSMRYRVDQVNKKGYIFRFCKLIHFCLACLFFSCSFLLLWGQRCVFLFVFKRLCCLFCFLVLFFVVVMLVLFYCVTMALPCRFQTVHFVSAARPKRQKRLCQWQQATPTQRPPPAQLH